jgi:large repetitive protein
MKKVLSLVLGLALPLGLFAQSLSINEFLASNDAGLQDPAGEFEDWVELYNFGESDVDIAGLYFTDGDEDLWEIPAGFPEETTVTAGGFIVLYFDKDSEQGPLHVEAKLGGSGEAIFVYAADGTTLIDSHEFGEQTTDISEGRETEGSDTWIFFETPTPRAANDGTPSLLINEFLASNDTGLQDPQGDFEDWVELYNFGLSDLDIAGMFFTDGDEDLWEIPAGFPEVTTVPAGGFLILFFDKDSEDGPLHVEAKLSGSGEAVFMYAADGTTVVDSYEYGEQTTDISMGRVVDGGSEWTFFETSTPGASNDDSALSPQDLPLAFGISKAWPNPFNPGTTLEFVLPTGQQASVRVYDLLGREVFVAADAVFAAGTQRLSLDFAGRGLSAGAYFVALETASQKDVTRILYLK